MYLTQPLRMRRDYGEKEMIDIKEMEEALSESRKTGHPLLDEYVLFDGDVLSKFASDELAASELIEALEEEADTIPLGKGKVWRVADDEETNEDEKEARHEEGKSVDPTDDMSEEDKKKWKEMTEKNKDKFKDKKAENATLETTLNDRIAAANLHTDLHNTIASAYSDYMALVTTELMGLFKKTGSKVKKTSTNTFTVYSFQSSAEIWLKGWKKHQMIVQLPKKKILGRVADSLKPGEYAADLFKKIMPKVDTGDKVGAEKATHSITAHDLAKIDSGRSKAASEGAYADRLNVVAKLLSLSKNEVRARIALDEVSDVLDLYGVETAEKDGQKALYINTGDTNRPTLVYSTANGRMVVASAAALFRTGFQREETNIKTANRCTLPSKREGHIMDFGVDRLHGRFFQLTNPKGETVIDQDQLQHNEVAHLLKKYGSTSQALDRAINTFTLNLNLQEMGLNPEKGPDPKKIRLAELRELRKLRKEAEEVAKFSNDPTSVSDWIAWED